jgi:hypothetical protein
MDGVAEERSRRRMKDTPSGKLPSRMRMRRFEKVMALI